jgi:hypothetical protein
MLVLLDLCHTSELVVHHRNVIYPGLERPQPLMEEVLDCSTTKVLEERALLRPETHVPIGMNVL